MELFSFGLILISSFTHAYWNFLAKRSEQKDIVVGLSKLVEVVLSAIPYLVCLAFFPLGKGYWSIIIVAAIFVLANYLCIAQAYIHLDLSLAYPLSRASAVFLPLIAFLFLRETIDLFGWLAILVTTGGVLLLSLEERGKSARSKLEMTGLIFAVLAALTTACYTVWGKKAVQEIHPFVYFYGYTVLTGIGYGGTLLKKFPCSHITREWERNKWVIVAVGMLNTFTYLLVLIALTYSKATYVGTLRQLSLIFGVLLGWKVLHERLSASRLAGVLCIIAGSSFILFAK